MKNYLKLFSVFASFVFIMSCNEETHDPINKDSITPGTISSPMVTNTPGGAIIEYTTPDDDDLLYVEAKYKLTNGVEHKVRASVYSDTLKLQGFGNTEKYKVNLYSVDRSENRSSPLEVEIEPLIPPVKTVFKTLQIKATFGGVNLSWENETNAAVDLIFSSTANGTTGPLDVKEIFYTKASVGNVSVRGFEPMEHTFSAVFRDRWGNYSERLTVNLVPIFEVELDKANFEAVILPGDTKQVPPWNSGAGTSLPSLWDNNASSRLIGFNGEMPDNYYYTFDLGKLSKLSRMKFFQFTESNFKWLYFDAQYKKFEIWGAENLDATGAWDNWVKLKDCEVIKPSGNPLEAWNYTNEDKEVAINGHEFEFPIDIPKVRYIRIKVLSTWSGLNWAACGEMSFWGSKD